LTAMSRARSQPAMFGPAALTGRYYRLP
jgi:hypothetical protein